MKARFLTGMLVFVFVSAFCAVELFAKDLTKMRIVVTGPDGKPVERADVIVRFGGRTIKKLGRKAVTQWEMRSTQLGEADIPEMPKGSIRIQVIAKGFQTFGETFDVNEDERTIQISLQTPQKQYSAHEH